MATDRIIGIDLGTTNSLVAYMQGDTPAVIPGEDDADVDVVRSVVVGTPASALIAASAAADLLVVGSRGLGGFRGLLLGSVSQQCAYHAGCPVVIVRSRAP